jgi:Ca-activated chloride channel family protein
LLLAGCGKRDAPAPAAEAPPAAAPFSILAGSELKDLEPAITAAAHAAGVEVKLSYAGTLDAVERLNAGERFDALLPPNGAYPALALNTKPLAREKLFYSRIALGVKAVKLKALGWDAKPPGWAEIAQAASTGKLRYAMTSASGSNTGMSALFAVASASAGKSEDLTVDDVKPELITAFLSGQKLTAGSSGWLADAFVKAPGELDAMVNYEAVILRANERLQPADKLSLVYPRDGMISADYPLMLLREDRRADYTRLVAALKAAPFQGEALSAAFLRPANPEVKPAAALPQGAVAELSFPNRLDVIDAVLGAYQSKWRKPATSIFVLDISGSMRGDGRIDAMREALKVLAGAGESSATARYAAFQQRERVVLIAFDDKVEPPQWVRFDGDLAAARRQVLERAEALTPRGGTAIFSALDAAEQLAAAERQADPERFISIVLLTDGENNRGMRFDDFRAKYEWHAPAPVFPIVFGEANQSQMQALASVTGGREFDGRKARLAQVFREIRGYQ